MIEPIDVSSIELAKYKDKPPAAFKGLFTQQGQINLCAQLLFVIIDKVNEIVEVVNNG